MGRQSSHLIWSAVMALTCGFWGAGAWAAPPEWQTLGAEQQALLQPLAARWEQYPEPMRERLLETARRYPQMTGEQKARVRERIGQWANLSQEQQDRARENYRRFQALPPEERQKILDQARQRRMQHQEASGPDRPGHQGPNMGGPGYGH